MPTYPFLHPSWIKEARSIHAAYLAQAEATTVTIRMNLVVEAVPFSDGPLLAHVDTTSGVLEIDLDHLTEPDVSVSLDYETAKAVIVEGRGDAALSAFMEGKIRVEGDVTKLLAYQSAAPSALSAEISGALRAITAP